MPINPLTDHVAGTVMNLATLLGNNELIEDYLKGNIDAADMAVYLSRTHGMPGNNHRLYVQDGSSEGLNSNPDVIYNSKQHMDIYPSGISLDNDCVLDFTFYGGDRMKDFVSDETYLEEYQPAPRNITIKPEDFIGMWAWERLGSNPETDAKKMLTTCPDSWHNWLFNLDSPGDIVGISDWVDGRDYTGRFPDQSYYDRWLTVPYGSKRVWIPHRCNLYVVAMAQGTWNHNFGNAKFHWWSNPLTGDNAHYFMGNPGGDRAAMFRLFVDRDNNPDKIFRWKVNGETFNSNWSPVQDTSDARGLLVGYGSDLDAGVYQHKQLGVEWSFTCFPRGVARVASKIHIPEPGYYNISMRYNSRYFKGFVNDSNEWESEKFAYRQTQIQYTEDPGGINVPDAPGPIHAARWEKVQIGAVAHFADATPNDTINEG